MISHALLAVDCGGTKCDMMLVDITTGRPLARANGRSSEIPNVVATGGAGRSPEMVQLVWSRIRERYGDRPLPRLSLVINIQASIALALEGLAGNVDRIVPITEADASLALGGQEHGLVVLSGTGASIFGRTPAGKNYAFDGLGPLLGDEGSAYWIGTRFLQLAARQVRLDSANPPDGWRELIEFLGYGDLPHPLWGIVGMMIRNPDRSTIAAVSQLVEQLAQRGNAGAVQILEAAAGRLADNTITLADHIGFTADSPVTVVGVGSVLNKGRIVWPLLARLLEQHFTHGRIVCPDTPQVAGQVIAVLRRDKNFQALNNFIKEV